MPETIGTLGQAAPAANTDTALYTAAAATSAVVSSLVVCNTGGAATTFRVHLRNEGAAVGVGNALVYDMTLAAKETIALTLGIALDAADVLSVRSASGTVTFTACGTEVT